MRVRWLRKALPNLDEEATCISVDDLAAAEQVVKRILDAVARLEDQPSLGRPGRLPGTREWIVPGTRCIRFLSSTRWILRLPCVSYCIWRPPKHWKPLQAILVE